jgi:hypothetical protein
LRGPREAQFEFTLAAIAQNLGRLARLVARPPPGVDFMVLDATELERELALAGQLVLHRQATLILLERRFNSAFLLAGDARLLQVELVFDAAARFIADPPILQQPVNIFAFRGDQLLPEDRRDRSGIEPV